jgi:hypothetical protein
MRESMQKFVVRLVREVTTVEYQDYEVIVEAECESDVLELAQDMVDGGYEVDDESWSFINSEVTDESMIEAVSSRPIEDYEDEGDFEVMSTDNKIGRDGEAVATT